MFIKNKQSHTQTIAVIFILFFLSSCGNTDRPATGDPVVVTDLLGREVVVPDNIERIIGLRAGALRLLVYMDAVQLIAGVEQSEKRGKKPYLKAYPELMQLPSIGPAMGGDAEMILNAQPDVIFITYTTRQDADMLQRKTGIPVVALECTDLGTDNETLFASLKLIGQVINKEERADLLISYITNNINELEKRTSKVSKYNKPSVYTGGLSYSTSYGISATHSRFAPFMFVNANNVASSIDERLTSHVRGTFVDIEKLMLWNPDYIFIDESGLQMVRKDINKKPVLRSSLKAIKNNNIFCLLAYNNYATNYEYVLLNAWYIGKQLYPAEFEDININKKAEELLYQFYSKNVADKLLTSSVALNRIPVEEL